MVAVQYSKTSDGKIVLMGEYIDEPGKLITKLFDSFNEAVEYADSH